MLTASKGESVPPVEAGVHEAICYSVVDIGTHSSQWGKKTIRNRQVVITWEIPGERIDIEDKVTHEVRDMPRALSRAYTISMNEKSNLRKHLASWRGADFTPEEEQAFELKQLLGQPCLLNVVHKPKQGGGIKAIVDGVMKRKFKKGEKRPMSENTVTIYGIEENGTDIPSTVPNWIVDQIKSSEEYMELVGIGPDGTAPDDASPDEGFEPVADEDIPF